MRGTERRLSIMKQMQEQGHMEVADLAELYGVSAMTIRRDLAKLEEEGLVIQEYGGAVLNTGSMFEYNMNMKQCEYQEEKIRIAKACAAYIKEGDTIFLDAGTTVCELARVLTSFKNIIVMTHSLLAANILAGADVEVIMCPGRFRAKSMAYMGQLTDQFLTSFRIDKLFLGVEGVSLATGLSVPNVTDGVTKQNLIQRSKWVACMVDSSKLEKSFFYNICDISKIDLLVTDSGISEKYKEQYEKNKQILIV